MSHGEKHRRNLCNNQILPREGFENAIPVKCRLENCERRYSADHAGRRHGLPVADFIQGLRERRVVPHVAEHKANDKGLNWLSPEERHGPRFAISQKKRKLVEKVFGWGKADSLLRQVELRGEKKVDGFFRLLATASNLVRMKKLIPAV